MSYNSYSYPYNGSGQYPQNLSGYGHYPSQSSLTPYSSKNAKRGVRTRSSSSSDSAGSAFSDHGDSTESSAPSCHSGVESLNDGIQTDGGAAGPIYPYQDIDLRYAGSARPRVKSISTEPLSKESHAYLAS